MSRCFKRYDVKQLRQGGCVPATREKVEGLNPSLFTAMLAVAPLLINSELNQR